MSLLRRVQLFAAFLILSIPLHAATSEWASIGPDGKLVYKATPAGDRILDFSHAGYMGGGIPLPDVQAKITIKPSGADDDTATIQAAIDAVSTMPLQGHFRGAVELAPGVFNCSRSLVLHTSGVVLRGAGSGIDGTTTTIRMSGPRHPAVVIGAPRGRRDQPGNDNQSQSVSPPAESSIADAYVAAGTNSFTVADASVFKVGDHVAIHRPTTAAWIEFMEMHNLSRNRRKQNWLGVGRNLVTERTITAIDGNKLILDIPLADSYDAKYLNPPGTRVAKITPRSRLSHVGVEGLHLQCEPIESSYGRHPYSGVRVGGDDCWVRDVFCDETMNSTVITGNRVTLQRVSVKHTFPNLGASKPADFSIEGSQILIDRCSASGGNTYFVWTSSLKPGPNVVLNSDFRGIGSRLQPHMRWSTGLLFDNCNVPDGGIDFMNRGVMGSGHGWTMGWGVAWNSVAKAYVIQNPPGVINWAIGCIGERTQTARPFDPQPLLPEGTFDSHGTPVEPRSLYLAQLAERLGPGALKNLGYSEEGQSLLKVRPVAVPSRNPRVAEGDLGEDLAVYRPINAGGGRGGSRQFSGERAVDEDVETYWSPGQPTGTLEVDLEGPVRINACEISEPQEMEHVLRYRVEGQINSDWIPLAEGTTIGAAKIHRFDSVIPWKVRLVIEESKSAAAIHTFSLYSEKR